MILDSTFLGDLADQVPAARALARDLDERQVPTRVPTVVVWEAFTGIGNAYPDRADELRAVYERLLASRSSVDLNPTTARHADHSGAYGFVTVSSRVIASIPSKSSSKA